MTQWPSVLLLVAALLPGVAQSEDAVSLPGVADHGDGGEIPLPFASTCGLRELIQASPRLGYECASSS